jgi:hypothetical protein
MVSSRKTLIFAVLLAAAGAAAQAPPAAHIVEPPPPLLPQQIGSFQKNAPAPVGDGLGSLDAAQAPVMKEDGIRRFEKSDFTSGPFHGTLTVYQFFDVSGAYAAFCYERSQGFNQPAKKVGGATASGPDGILFQSGINLVIAHFDKSTPKLPAVFDELITHLPKASGPASQPPLLPTYLPEKNLVPGSLRYALGPAAYTAMGGVLPANILTFDKAGESVTGDYQIHAHKERGVVTLLLYPTPTIAGDVSRAVDAQLHAQPPAGVAKLRREGPLLILATGGFSEKEAQEMVDQIHLHSEVSWNKALPPEFHTEVRKTASLLTSILVFSGVLGLAAILLGLFLGFGRAWVRVLMGKPAASEPEFLRIDFSGKPAADATDRTPPTT